MGFFSFLTTDTNESIANIYSGRELFTVHVLDNKGNVWSEHNYEGYGIFGGKDIYELIAEMNGKETRDAGIGLYYKKNSVNEILFPNIVRHMDKSTVWTWTNTRLIDCPQQGFFYNNSDENKDEDDNDDDNDDNDNDYNNENDDDN